MLIGISGTLGAGKTEVVRYLTFQGFKLISYSNDYSESDECPTHLKSPSVSPPPSDDPSLQTISGNDDLPSDISLTSLEPYKTFNSLEKLLDFVTLNWRTNFVISHMRDIEMLETLQKRPFFLHISIDAPLQLRFQRSIKAGSDDTSSGLTQFVLDNDKLLFAPENPLIEINNQAQIKIINTSSSIKDLYIKLSELVLTDMSRLRPTWDSYFMRLADLAALRSNCMKRRVGCVIVRGNRVVATGYNGTPRNLTNCNEGGCPRCNKGQGSGAGLNTCLCLHAEENALLEAGRDRITGIGSASDRGVLYCNTCPCLTCSIKIVQSGIKEVVFAQSYSMDDLSHKVMSEAGIVLRQFSPPAEGVFI
ncbi:deoxycytidylate deaminase [[Candida] railenensis]|uniref:Deoxycytidylate deaminase n=1 Tax=[Candida] railenensis TaxID=45579 RepID=A0A9P0QWD3_9ASCO|nr:deoxycytidylate deaminase [[Candida] railenensis]